MLARLKSGLLYALRLHKDHYCVHAPGPPFEGFYTRIQDHERATFAVILCWVKDAKIRRNLVHVSYTPVTSTPIIPHFKAEIFPERLDKILIPDSEANARTLIEGKSIELLAKFGDNRDLQQPFCLQVPPYRHTEAHKGSSAETTAEYVVGKHAQRYVINFPHPGDGSAMCLKVDLSERKPWNEPYSGTKIRAGTSSRADFLGGPEGSLVRLSKLLPLHWYVFSTRSKAAYNLSREGKTIIKGEGWAHQEKNWGISFPSGWIWMHAVSPDASTYLSLAGGSILGISAYLIGFRSTKFVWDFRPPITILPFLTRVKRDSTKGHLDMTVRSLYRKLVIRVRSPPDTFMPIACPLSHGHEPDYAIESFHSNVEIRVYTRTRLWSAWNLADSHQIGQGALEFGGKFSHHTKDATKREAVK